ncbi:DNA sulfur modification protein DndB [Paenibacillus sp. USHLN196]|uniref:DNA sulfur modification protein DndB n=1 Tax=Paenibacillus sp. USHLN196 TaxID=3081291 RepID=UPI003018A87E
MKVDRNIIEKEVLENLKLIQNSRQKQYELNLKLADYNVPFGMVQKISQNEEVISEFDVHHLIGIVSAMYDADNSNPNPETYFGVREIRDAERTLKDKDLDKLYLPHTFKEVIEIKFDSYITKINIKELVKMVDSQLIIYEEETQRGVTYKENKSGGIVKTPIVNKASVKRIASKVSENQYFEDMITLNVYSTEVEPVSYDTNSKSLTINDGAIVSILDGFHRLQGFIAAVSLNPDVELNEILSIRVYDYETAKRFFSQLNTINVLNKERRKELAQERLSDKVVADLQRKSEIGKQIASGSMVSDLAGDLTTFDIMSYAIDRSYTIERQLDVIKISKYLNEFFVYLVGSYPNEFSKNFNERKNEFMSHPLMFIGYIVLSRYMQDNEIDFDEIEKYIDTIGKNADEFVPLLNAKKSLTGNKRIREKLFDYFVNVFGGDKSE